MNNYFTMKKLKSINLPFQENDYKDLHRKLKSPVCFFDCCLPTIIIYEYNII